MEDNQLRHALFNVALPMPTNEISGTEQTGSSESSTGMIILRLVSVVLIGCTSLWASIEANKGFHITILNDTCRDDSLAGRRFQLLYESNDRATRLLLESSQFLETLLYPTNQTYRKKQVNHVTLRLASQNLTKPVTVDYYREGKFVINLCPSIMEKTNVKSAMLRAVGQGMAQVWIFNNRRNTPRTLINGLVEYATRRLTHISAEVELGYGPGKPGYDDTCWIDENPNAVARFLSYCEKISHGFIQRLNQAMSQNSNWHDGDLGNALGMPAHLLCSSYTSLELLLSDSLDSSSDKML